MLNVFSLANGRLFQEEIESRAALSNVQPVWVDLDAPTAEEKGWIAQHFGVTIAAVREACATVRKYGKTMHARALDALTDRFQAGGLIADFVRN